MTIPPNQRKELNSMASSINNGKPNPPSGMNIDKELLKTLQQWWDAKDTPEADAEALAQIKSLLYKEVIAELEKLVKDTLSPENFGGRFIHEPVTEFAKQQEEWINERIEELQRAKERLT